MTEDQLSLIANRIMDRVERDGNGLQLAALVEELRAGLAIVEAQPFDPVRPGGQSRNHYFGYTVPPATPPAKAKLIQISPEMDEWLANWIKNNN